MKIKYLFILLLFNSAFCQKIEVYNDELYACEDQILFNKISFGLENNTNETLLFYKSIEDFRYNNTNILKNPLEFHDNILDFDYFLSPMLVISDSEGKELMESELPPFADHSLAVFNEREMYFEELIKNGKLEKFIEDRFIILKPNETYYFVRYIALPNHATKENFYEYRYDMDREESYFFKIRFVQSGNLIKAILPKNYLKKLQKEEVIIFDGVIDSNEGQIKWLND